MKKIKFGTDGWRAIIGEDFTLANLSRVTEGYIYWLKNNFEKPSTILGYDCRFNGKYFATHVANLLAQNGIKVFISPGFVSTPMVSLATLKRQASAGIIITASHNPPEYSGFKIKGNYGGPAFPSIISEVEAAIPDYTKDYEDKFEELVSKKQIEYYDMEALYINHLKEAFDLNAIRNSGFTIGYDAMYGAGQNVIKKILPAAKLLHCDFNPSFKGTAPEPIEKNLVEFAEFIQKEKIDIGLATDGDADRIGLLDKEGNFIDSHHIILLLIHYLHKYKQWEGKVISTFSCSQRIQKLCFLYDLPIEVTKIGFKYICEIMTEEDVLVGGEESGGIAIKGHIPERDGIYIGLTIMEMMAKSHKTLDELIDEIYEIVGGFSFQRYDLHLTEHEKQQIIKNCEADNYKSFGKYPVNSLETLDGFKFHLNDDQWVMIRPSGTEPVLRTYAESSSSSEAINILEATKQTILNN